MSADVYHKMLGPVHRRIVVMIYRVDYPNCDRETKAPIDWGQMLWL